MTEQTMKDGVNFTKNIPEHEKEIIMEKLGGLFDRQHTYGEAFLDGTLTLLSIYVYSKLGIYIGKKIVHFWWHVNEDEFGGK